MGRHRTKGNLPTNWTLEAGTFYFRPGRGAKRVRLGRTLSEAYRTFGTLLELNQRPTVKLKGWMDRYRREVIPTKALRTQQDNLKEMENLEKAFGEMLPEEVEPQHIYAYRAARGAKVRFNREKALFSHLFTKIIEWGGFPGPNPCREVKRNTEVPKDHYVEDWELAGFLKHASLKVGLYAKLKLKTGLRKGDILRLTLPNLNLEGISLISRKKARKRKVEGGFEVATEGKALTILWDDELREIVNQIKALPCPVKSIYLFSTREGQPYTEDGFDAMWKRYMVKAVKAEGIRRFGDHDLRAKTASDDPENAQDRLDHGDAKTTEVYIRNRSKHRVAALPDAMKRLVKAEGELREIKAIRGKTK